MTERDLLVSQFEAKTIYQNFEEFVAKHEAMCRTRRLDAIPVMQLLFLARNDIKTAKRVFKWAIKIPFLEMLEHFGSPVVVFSDQGREQAQAAEDRFGQNPLYAIVMLESILMLEKLTPWAEDALRSETSMSLDELRQRSEEQGEELARQGWLDHLYQGAQQYAMHVVEKYARLRDGSIAIAVAAAAGGYEPTRDEVIRILQMIPPTRHSNHRQRLQAADNTRHIGSVDSTVEWVLGKDLREIPF